MKILQIPKMSKSVILVGGNLVSDTAFRKKLAGRDAGVELQMVVEDLLSRFVPLASSNNVNSCV